MAIFTMDFKIVITTDQEEIQVRIDSRSFNEALSHASDVCDLALGLIKSVTVTFED